MSTRRDKKRLSSGHIKSGNRENSASLEGKHITCTRFDDVGSRLAIGFRDGDITVMDLSTKTVHVELVETRHRGGISALAFAPDGKTLVSGSEDSQILVWDLASKKKTRSLLGHKARSDGT